MSDSLLFAEIEAAEDQCLRHDLLSAEEEIALAKRIKAGREAQAALDGKKLRGAAVRRAERLAEDGILAGKELALANQRLVLSIALPWAKIMHTSLSEVRNIGNEGLMLAVVKFDYQRGTRFSTFATPWILQALRRTHADKTRPIRLPAHLHDSLNRIRKIAERLRVELGREPLTDELAFFAGVSVEKLTKWLEADKRVVSLDKPVNEEEDATFGDFIASGVDVQTIVERRVLAGEVAAALEGILSPREYRVLTLRFGLGGSDVHTLEEISEMGKDCEVIGKLTRERIRQIEAIAFKKVRELAHLQGWL